MRSLEKSSGSAATTSAGAAVGPPGPAPGLAAATAAAAAAQRNAAPPPELKPTPYRHGGSPALARTPTSLTQCREMGVDDHPVPWALSHRPALKLPDSEHLRTIRIGMGAGGGMAWQVCCVAAWLTLDTAGTAGTAVRVHDKVYRDQIQVGVFVCVWGGWCCICREKRARRLTLCYCVCAFQWDMTADARQPMAFAETVCADMVRCFVAKGNPKPFLARCLLTPGVTQGLPPEFMPSIAVAIQAQVNEYHLVRPATWLLACWSARSSGLANPFCFDASKLTPLWYRARLLHGHHHPR